MRAMGAMAGCVQGKAGLREVLRFSCDGPGTGSLGVRRYIQSTLVVFVLMGSVEINWLDKILWQLVIRL